MKLCNVTIPNCYIDCYNELFEKKVFSKQTARVEKMRRVKFVFSEIYVININQICTYVR